MQIHDKVPPFSFKATSGLQSNLSEYLGKWVILYFYPRDATPGCTTEGQDFRDNYESFQEEEAVIFGISRDSLPTHERFKSNQTLPFELISDQDEALCQLFDVMKNKSMYGKQVRGIERSTFLIDTQGILKHQWRKVKVERHVAEVLKTLKEERQ